MAGEKKGFGAIAKRWLEAKKTELLTTNNRQRENARYEEEQSEKAMREKVGEEAVLGLFPGLRKFQDNQEKARADAEARRIDEQRALPIAEVSLTFSGEVNGSWSGECHVEAGAGDGVASIGLVVIPGEWPIVGGAPFGGWNFLIPGFDGPRTYDLVAIGEALEASGNDLDYVDFGLLLGSEDDPYMWAPSVGAASVDVAADGRTLTVRMTMVNSGGQLVAEGRIVLPTPLAA